MSLTQSQEELITLFRETKAPILTAPEVGEEFGITQQAAYNRLKRLHDEGVVARKEVGSRAVAWWLREN